ncbi:hypothetical protein NFI96_007570, partial [Prochilodus magdalenae]
MFTANGIFSAFVVESAFVCVWNKAGGSRTIAAEAPPSLGCVGHPASGSVSTDSMAAIGVHFGYTCACVAVFKDGRADVVANDAGDRVTPAVVAYRDTEQIVGIAAKQGRIRNAANTVVKVKQILGR